MKRHSTSYIISKRHIRTEMRYHHMPIRIAQIQNNDNTKY